MDTSNANRTRSEWERSRPDEKGIETRIECTVGDADDRPGALPPR